MAVTRADRSQPQHDTNRRRWRVSRRVLAENAVGFAFILPAVLLISVFGLIPIGYAFFMSLHNWRLGNMPNTWVGPQNYQQILGSWSGVAWLSGGLLLLIAAYYVARYVARVVRALPTASAVKRWHRLPTYLVLLVALACIGHGWGLMRAAGDGRFLRAIEVTFYYAIFTVPIQIALGLLISYALFQNLRGQALFRTIFFVPYIVPVVAASVVFRTLFARGDSVANALWQLLGFAPQDWLYDRRPVLEAFLGIDVSNWSSFWQGPSVALLVAIIFGIWNYTGFNVMLFLAGLGGIAKELYEAAEIDGANRWQRFIHITLPQLSPITFYASMVGFIGVLQVFNTVFVMRTPQAGGTMDTVGVVIFDTFFRRNQYGPATAQAIILMILILYVTFIQYRIFARRVHT
jgi:ABC-type sugar transport system permease subunit